MLYFWVIWIGCSEQTTDWVSLYKQSNSEFQFQIELQDTITKENIWLKVLAEHPKDARVICTKLTQKTAQNTCKRYLERPHLQTIVPEQTANWNGGYLWERLLFPRGFTPLPSDLTAVTMNTECSNQPLCIETLAETLSFDDWKKAGWVCSQMDSPRAQSDCTFNIAERLPVHVDNYVSAAKLCSLSMGFSGECHNHVLLKYASKMGDRLDWHLQLIDIFKATYSTEYTNQLTDAYWSLIAFRTIGIEYPLSIHRFKEWPEDFQQQIRSIIALRVWDEEHPYQMAQRAMNGELLRVQKVRGPGAPRFNPHPIWTDLSVKMKWQRFCDVRGGYRPVHENPTVDLVWALLTSSMYADPPRIDYWTEILETIGQEYWEIRWAMAVLLKSKSIESELITILKKDSDTRVRQATL